MMRVQRTTQSWMPEADRLETRTSLRLKGKPLTFIFIIDFEHPITSTLNLVWIKLAFNSLTVDPKHQFDESNENQSMNYFSVCPDAFLTNYYFMLLTQSLHNPHRDCRVSYCCVFLLSISVSVLISSLLKV